MTEEKPLPQGWCKKDSKSHGRPYYYHKDTRKVQWEVPKELVKKAKHNKTILTSTIIDTDDILYMSDDNSSSHDRSSSGAKARVKKVLEKPLKRLEKKDKKQKNSKQDKAKFNHSMSSLMSRIEGANDIGVKLHSSQKEVKKSVIKSVLLNKSLVSQHDNPSTSAVSLASASVTSVIDGARGAAWNQSPMRFDVTADPRIPSRNHVQIDRSTMHSINTATISAQAQNKQPISLLSCHVSPATSLLSDIRLPPPLPTVRAYPVYPSTSSGNNSMVGTPVQMPSPIPSVATFFGMMPPGVTKVLGPRVSPSPALLPHSSASMNDIEMLDEVESSPDLEIIADLTTNTSYSMHDQVPSYVPSPIPTAQNSINYPVPMEVDEVDQAIGAIRDEYNLQQQNRRNQRNIHRQLNVVPRELEQLTKYTYLVIDTNVFLRDLNSLLKSCVGLIIENNIIVLVVPYIVVEELDRLKTGNRIGKQARDAVTFIRDHSVKSKETFILQPPESNNFPIRGYDEFNADDQIVKCVIQLQSSLDQYKLRTGINRHAVKLISNDINLLNKATANRLSGASAKDMIETIRQCKMEIEKQRNQQMPSTSRLTAAETNDDQGPTLFPVSRPRSAASPEFLKILSHEVGRQIFSLVAKLRDVIVGESKLAYSESWDRVININQFSTFRDGNIRLILRHWVAVFRYVWTRSNQKNDLTQLQKYIQTVNLHGNSMESYFKSENELVSMIVHADSVLNPCSKSAPNQWWGEFASERQAFVNALSQIRNRPEMDTYDHNNDVTIISNNNNILNLTIVENYFDLAITQILRVCQELCSADIVCYKTAKGVGVNNKLKLTLATAKGKHDIFIACIGNLTDMLNNIKQREMTRYDLKNIIEVVQKVIPDLQEIIGPIPDNHLFDRSQTEPHLMSFCVELVYIVCLNHNIEMGEALWLKYKNKSGESLNYRSLLRYTKDAMSDTIPPINNRHAQSDSLIFAYPLNPPLSYPCGFEDPIGSKCKPGIMIELILYTASVLGVRPKIVQSSGYGLGPDNDDSPNTTMSLLALNKAHVSGPDFLVIPERIRHATPSGTFTYSSLGCAIRSPSSTGTNISYSILAFGSIRLWLLQIVTVIVVALIYCGVRRLAGGSGRLRLTRKLSSLLVCLAAIYIGVYLNLYSSDLSISLFRSAELNLPFKTFNAAMQAVIEGRYQVVLMEGTAEAHGYLKYIERELKWHRRSLDSLKNVIMVPTLLAALEKLSTRPNIYLAFSLDDLKMVALPCAGFTVITGDDFPQTLMGFYFGRSVAHFLNEKINTDILKILNRHRRVLFGREIIEREVEQCFRRNVSSSLMEPRFVPLKAIKAYGLFVPLFVGLSTAICFKIVELLPGFQRVIIEWCMNYFPRNRWTPTPSKIDSMSERKCGGEMFADVGKRKQ